MSEQLSFDRKKGFVALPVEVLDIDLSPGAFRTLVELCRMANAEGFCWPSLGQLSARMGRSKAAISGYVQELRGAGLIDTQEQQMANGYNYRLKYRVTFWQTWRASLTGKTATKTEHRVQPTERFKKLKKQRHKTQLVDREETSIDHLLKDWARCFHGAPYPTARSEPTDEMLAKTKALLSSGPHEPSTMSADIEAQLRATWSDLHLRGGDDHVSDQARALVAAGLTQHEVAQVLDHIRSKWPVHWRQSPTLEQFKKLLNASKVTAHSRKISLLEGYQKRWARAEKHLRATLPFCSVTSNIPPASPGWQAEKYPRI